METINKANNNTLGTLLKWGLGITVAYSLLPQNARENMGKYKR
jgi:tetratricopeptide (TPR) repeat protein